MRHNSGRSTTLSPHPERDYLLKGIIRCAYCKMPMWAQTYKSGRRYYREHRESRSNTQCPAHGGSIPCRLADEQVGRIVEAIELGPAWQEQLLSIISARGRGRSSPSQAAKGPGEASETRQDLCRWSL